VAFMHAAARVTTGARGSLASQRLVHARQRDIKPNPWPFVPANWLAGGPLAGAASARVAVKLNAGL
jgi:hypothetical protein